MCFWSSISIVFLIYSPFSLQYFFTAFSVSLPNFPLGVLLKNPNFFSFFCISITSEPYIPDFKFLSPLPNGPYTPSTIVTSDEECGGLKAIEKFASAHPDKLAIKAGVINGDYCDEAMIKEYTAIRRKENA